MESLAKYDWLPLDEKDIASLADTIDWQNQLMRLAIKSMCRPSDPRTVTRDELRDRVLVVGEFLGKFIAEANKEMK